MNSLWLQDDDFKSRIGKIATRTSAQGKVRISSSREQRLGEGSVVFNSSRIRFNDNFNEIDLNFIRRWKIYSVFIIF